MSSQPKETTWGSRLGFILASAGSAIGLGAIWKFPYMAGTNGGAVFMLPFIFFTLTIGVALLIAEFSMGRAGRMGPVGSLTRIAGRPWGVFGAIGTLTVFIILSFYSSVGGWTFKYLVDAITGAGIINDPALLGSHFGGFISNSPLAFAFQVAFIAVTALIVYRGVDKGIEQIAKYLMPVLFLLMLVLIVRGVTLPGLGQGLNIYLCLVGKTSTVRHFLMPWAFAFSRFLWVPVP